MGSYWASFTKLLANGFPGPRGQHGLQIHFSPRTMDESRLRNQSTKNILVIGLPRTGTSIMQRLLNAYPSVFITYESIYTPGLGTNSADAIHGYYYEILKQYKHLTLSLPPDDLPVGIKPFSFEQRYDYFGDKVIYRPTKTFRQRLSSAIRRKQVDKVIFTVRDPRARSLSLLKWRDKRNESYPLTRDEFRPKNNQAEYLETQGQIWSDYVQQILELLNTNPNCIYVKYENLIQSPRNEIDTILRFLELDNQTYPYRCLEAIKSGSVDKWKDELESEFAESVKAITADGMRPFDYN